MRKTLPEDLIDLVIAADAQRRVLKGFASSRYKPWQRVWIEPIFNLLGGILGIFIASMSPRRRERTLFYLCQKLQGHAPEENPKLPERISETVAMAKKIHRTTGQWPAVLLFTSHGETIGPLAWIRFEIIRQAMRLGFALTAADPTQQTPRHPKCFLAIDPYALDTVPPAVGGLYAGAMNQVHLAWDRQMSTQSWVQRHWLLRGTGYDQIAWRLLKTLREHTPVIMVLSGGLPHNARMLYGAREFVRTLTPPHWPFSKREAEKRLMQILMTPAGQIRPPDDGSLPEETQVALRGWLTDLGIPDHGNALTNLAADFHRAVPYRERLLEILVARLARKGKPLLIANISHADRTPHVRVSHPLGIFGNASGVIEFLGDEFTDAHPPQGVSEIACRVGCHFTLLN